MKFSIFESTRSRATATDSDKASQNGESTSPSTIWDEIFDSYTYASLTKDAEDEINDHLAKFFNIDAPDQLPRFDDKRESFALSAFSSEDISQLKMLIGQEFPEIAKIDEFLNDYKKVSLSWADIEKIKNALKADSTGKQLSAKLVMTPNKRITIDAIFDKRNSRKKALDNSDALLDDTSNVGIQLLVDTAEANALEKQLRFALYQYLAQYQAATDHIGVIKSPHTERVKCYKQIRRCSILLKQTELKHIQLKRDHLKQLGSLNSVRPLKNQLDVESKHRQLQLLHELNVAEQTLITEQTLNKKPYEHLRPERLESALNPLFSYLPQSLQDFLDKDEDELDSDYILGQTNKLNARRLFWVWTRCDIEGFIITAHQILLVSTMIAAWVSFGLYWIRGGTTAAGGIQHGFDLWVSEQEKVIEAKKRRQAHWKERRDDILNDLIWGSSNFAGCFWLFGPSLLGFIGDLLTGVLLGMDLYLAYLRYADGWDEFYDSVDRCNKQLINVLETMSKEENKIQDQQLITLLDKMLKLMQGIEKDEREHKNKQKDELEELAVYRENLTTYMQSIGIKGRYHYSGTIEQLEVLVKRFTVLHSDKEVRKNHWTDKNKALVYDVCYAIVLMLAFWMMCGFYLSLIPVALPIAVSLLGATMLVVSTIVWRTANARLEWKGIELSEQSNEITYAKLMKRFIELGNEHANKLKLKKSKIVGLSSEDILLNDYDLERIDSQMKSLYWEMLKLGAASGHQHRIVQFKQIELARASLLRILVPLAIAMTLLFAPAMTLAVPTYVFLMLGVLVAAVASSYAIDKLCKPKKIEWQQENGKVGSLPSFKDAEYDAFKHLVLVPKKDDANQTIDETESMKNGNQLLNVMKINRVGNNSYLFQPLKTKSVVDVQVVSEDDETVSLISVQQMHRKDV